MWIAGCVGGEIDEGLPECGIACSCVPPENVGNERKQVKVGESDEQISCGWTPK